MLSESQQMFAKHVRGYIMIFVILMILTAVTVWAASWKVTVPVAIAIALLIAGTKGALVATGFMHLRSEKPFIFYCLLLTLILLLSVLLLPLATALLTMTHNAG